LKSILPVRKILLWTTLLHLLIIITPTVSVNASSSTAVKVEPSAKMANVGETFTVNITITDVQNLFGLEVTLYWNSSILQMMSVDVRLGVESYPDGVLHEPVSIVKNETIQEEGKYQLVAMSTGSETPSFNGTGNIVRITFNVTEVGSCKLNLETKLADKPPVGDVSSSIAHDTIDGFFGREAPEQPLWLYIVITIIVMVLIVAAAVMYRKRTKKAF